MLPCSPDLATSGRPGNYLFPRWEQGLMALTKPHREVKASRGFAAGRVPPHLPPTHPPGAVFQRSWGSGDKRLCARRARSCSEWGSSAVSSYSSRCLKDLRPLPLGGRNIRGVPRDLHLHAPHSPMMMVQALTSPISFLSATRSEAPGPGPGPGEGEGAGPGFPRPPGCCM